MKKGDCLPFQTYRQNSKVKKSSSTIARSSERIRFNNTETASEVGSEQFIMVKRITADNDNLTLSTAEEGTASSKKHNPMRSQRPESAKRSSPRKPLVESKKEESVTLQQAESNKKKNRKPYAQKSEPTSDTEAVKRE